MKLAYLFVLLLAGCSYNATLYPRGGGEQATGNYDGISALTVTLKGATYTGNATRGSTSGMVFTPGAFPTPVMGLSNQYSAVLGGPGGAVRCQFVLNMEGGNGVCQGPDGTIYDMVIR